MPTAEVATAFGCPKCKSDAISEINVMETLIRVVEWDEDGEPVAFGDNKDIYDSIQVKEDGLRYHCDSCDHEFDQPIRLEADYSEET